MATLLLTAVGSALGPIGGAIGALVGRSIDSRLFGSAGKEGPRLKELNVSGSSYGTPIARHFGTMRVPGTIIWSTDFVEHENKEGGGKGQPQATSFSYSVSFAVALGSSPIDRVGRIWADGNLLRGAGGDLKSGGELRIYTGSMVQPRDPLMEAALGERCPAYRGLAYAVFDDLDLTDFGNRIPALSFEIFAGEGGSVIERMLASEDVQVEAQTRFAELAGYSHDGGSIRDNVQLIDRLNPVRPVVEARRLHLDSARVAPTEAVLLPEAAAWDDGDFGQLSGQRRHRQSQSPSNIAALRYYDTGRDYQPGMQYARSDEDGGSTLEFPGAMAAGDAQQVATSANVRQALKSEIVSYRIAHLDPSLSPGTIVSLPDEAALWQVMSWEWRERGVELELARYRPDQTAQPISDPGRAWQPADREGAETVLRVFELPWDGVGMPSERKAYAAIGARAGRWPGARLYSERDGALSETGLFAARRAGTGRLVGELPSSASLRFESQARCIIALDDPAIGLPNVDPSGLAQWNNRLLVGSEVLQFATARPLGSGLWSLEGLLRGRGGTEAAAARGHVDGEFATVLDDRLVEMDQEVLASGGDAYAALGLTDTEAALATLEDRQASLRPPSPVHARLAVADDGALELSWVRRARGGWAWLDEVEQPLVEQSEQYELGIGPLETPYARWITRTPALRIEANDIAPLMEAHPAAEIWVRQVGTFARSDPARLGQIS